MDDSGRETGLRTPPVTASGLRFWLAAIAVMIVISAGVGWLILHPLAGSLGDLDTRIARWFEHRRTPTWDSVTWVGSGSAEAVVKITATLVLGAFFVWRWRRWNEIALLAGSLIFEVTVFTASTFIVDRDRPPIPPLDSVPPTSSFPSGHTAAAVAFYGALAIIVCWHVRSRWVRGLAVTVAIVLPPIVGLSRMYRGMHHFSDVLAGAVIGVVALLVTYHVTRVEQHEPSEISAMERQDVLLRTAG
jgi:undecaprenyl-diphosphatase